MAKELTDEDMEQFDWLTLQKDMDTLMPLETHSQKFIRKFKENPFVPIGKLHNIFFRTSK